MKTNEIEVNAEQIKAAWRLMQTHLEGAKELINLMDTASAIASIESALTLMDIMQGDVEDAPNELTALDKFVQDMVNDCNRVFHHTIHNPALTMHKDEICECGLFYAQQGSRLCKFCADAGGNGQ